MTAMRLGWLFGLVIFLSLVSGCGTDTVVVATTAVPTPTTTVTTAVVGTAASTTVTVTATATPASKLTTAQKANLIAKLDQVATLLTPLTKPGGLSSLFDKNKVIGAVRSEDIAFRGTELDGRLRLEPLLGQDPSLDQFRGSPGSSPPPEGGYLKALRAAILEDRLKTVGRIRPGQPITEVGADHLSLMSAGALVGFVYSESNAPYAREMPTEATKEKFDQNGASEGIIDIEPWKRAYFLLVEVEKTVATLNQAGK